MIARLEAGGAKENLADYDASEVTRGVAELYEPLAEEAGVELAVSADGSLPVHGSRELLGQALSNLVDNAIKYGAPGRSAHVQPAGAKAPAPAVLVTAKRQGPLVEIAVADRGPGISEADRTRAVERFVRLESARTRPGFGLGLSLASAVARLHGGALRLEDNAPGLRAVLALPGK
jgi:signal transduction histidine kinase